MKVYRIRDWSKHFENNRTRELKELRFVIMPNKHDGDGYTELLDHPNGAAHYGAWCTIVQVASKGQHPAEGCENPAGCCECRGILLRDGARPHDPASLSRLTRIPAKVFDEAIPRLIKVGWIETTEAQTLQTESDSAIPHPPAVSAAESRTPLQKDATLARARVTGMEGNGMEERKTGRAAQARRVFEFWQEHLNHPRSAFDGKRQRAIEGRLKDGYTEDQLIAAVKGCKKTPYNMGDNKDHQFYDDIELICRDAAHVDRFIKTFNNGNKPVDDHPVWMAGGK